MANAHLICSAILVHSTKEYGLLVVMDLNPSKHSRPDCARTEHVAIDVVKFVDGFQPLRWLQTFSTKLDAHVNFELVVGKKILN